LIKKLKQSKEYKRAFKKGRGHRVYISGIMKSLAKASIRISADKPHKRRIVYHHVLRRGFSVSEWKIIKQVLGAFFVLFFGLMLAFHSTPPKPTADGIIPRYDLIQISPLAHAEALQDVLTALEPKPLSDVQFTPGNDYEAGSCTFWVATWVRVPSALGDAHSWGYNAAAMGFTVSSTPTPGSVGVSLAGTWGHVVLLLQVQGDQIYIREGNFDFNGSVRERWANSSEFQQYIVF